MTKITNKRKIRIIRYTDYQIREIKRKYVYYAVLTYIGGGATEYCEL